MRLSLIEIDMGADPRFMENTVNTPMTISYIKSRKKLFVVLIVVILGLGGVGYWYVGIYWPAQYAKAVLTLETELQSYGAQSAQPQFRWRYDYDATMDTLTQHELFFTQFNKKIEDLSPPLFNQDMQNLQENLLFFGKTFLGGVDNARKRIDFTKNAIGLLRIYSPDSLTLRETQPPETRSAYLPEPRPQPFDLGTAIDDLKEQLTRGKFYADKMFNQGPLDLGGNTFAELKSLWEEMNRTADTVFPVAEQKFGRSYPLSSLPPPQELEKTIPGAASLDKFDKFETKLEGVVIRGGAEEIFRYSIYPQSPELESRSQSMSESLKKLKEKYGQ